MNRCAICGVQTRPDLFVCAGCHNLLLSAAIQNEIDEATSPERREGDKA